jgi:SWI/SNF-related matrix-associated actin-dependent regulator of chromatin subfamily D
MPMAILLRYDQRRNRVRVQVDDTPPQWHQNPSHPILDGFTIRRTGDTPTKVRLILHLQQYPEQFRVLPELGMAFLGDSARPPCKHGSFFSGNILGIKEESRAGLIQALWAYIKTQNLQDKFDRKRIHADAMLRPVCDIDLSNVKRLPIHCRYLATT